MSLKYYLIKVALLISVRTACLSQENIFTTDKLKPGLYLSFEEFINNSPSITSNFKLVSRSGSKQFWLGGGNFDIILEDTLVKKKFLRRKVWGLCTGDSVYVNSVSREYNFGYSVVKEIGRYCYLETMRSIAQSSGYTVGGIVGAINQKKDSF